MLRNGFAADGGVIMLQPYGDEIVPADSLPLRLLRFFAVFSVTCDFHVRNRSA